MGSVLVLPQNDLDTDSIATESTVEPTFVTESEVTGALRAVKMRRDLMDFDLLIRSLSKDPQARDPALVEALINVVLAIDTSVLPAGTVLPILNTENLSSLTEEQIESLISHLSEMHLILINAKMDQLYAPIYPEKPPKNRKKTLPEMLAGHIGAMNETLIDSECIQVGSDLEGSLTNIAPEDLMPNGREETLEAIFERVEEANDLLSAEGIAQICGRPFSDFQGRRLAGTATEVEYSNFRSYQQVILLKKYIELEAEFNESQQKRDWDYRQCKTFRARASFLFHECNFKRWGVRAAALTVAIIAVAALTSLAASIGLHTGEKVIGDVKSPINILLGGGLTALAMGICNSATYGRGIAGAAWKYGLNRREQIRILQEGLRESYGKMELAKSRSLSSKEEVYGDTKSDLPLGLSTEKLASIRKTQRRVLASCVVDSALFGGGTFSTLDEQFGMHAVIWGIAWFCTAAVFTAYYGLELGVAYVEKIARLDTSERSNNNQNFLKALAVGAVIAGAATLLFGVILGLSHFASLYLGYKIAIGIFAFINCAYISKWTNAAAAYEDRRQAVEGTGRGRLLLLLGIGVAFYAAILVGVPIPVDEIEIGMNALVALIVGVPFIVAAIWSYFKCNAPAVINSVSSLGGIDTKYDPLHLAIADEEGSDPVPAAKVGPNAGAKKDTGADDWVYVDAITATQAKQTKYAQLLSNFAGTLFGSSSKKAEGNSAESNPRLLSGLQRPMSMSPYPAAV